MSGGKYAVKTSVPVSRTRAELQHTIQERYGAKRYGVLEDVNSVSIAFTMRDRNIRLELYLPIRKAFRSESAFEQATRATWRAMLLYVKSKLEACDREVVEFEKEWMPHFIVEGGKTVYELAERHQLPFSTGRLLLGAGVGDIVDAEIVPMKGEEPA